MDLSRLGRDGEAAADLTQATFERAMEKLDELERGSVGAWLRITSRNLIREHMKTHR